jgi:hypothetical protein
VASDPFGDRSGEAPEIRPDRRVELVGRHVVGNRRAVRGPTLASLVVAIE